LLIRPKLPLHEFFQDEFRHQLEARFQWECGIATVYATPSALLSE